jgi:Rod binding domain-containing protein
MSVVTPLYAAGSGRVLPPLDTGRNAKPGTPEAKARKSAEDFEGVFMQTMMQEMFTGVGKEGPLGEGEAGGAWRSLLVQEYATTMARNGGIGIADSVYRDILALQKTKAR